MSIHIYRERGIYIYIYMYGDKTHFYICIFIYVYRFPLTTTCIIYINILKRSEHIFIIGTYFVVGHSLVYLQYLL